MEAIATGLDLSGAQAAIIAVGVTLGGFLVIGIGVRAILGFLKKA